MAQERDDLVYLAKLAEQAERFDEMVERRRWTHSTRRGLRGGGGRAAIPRNGPEKIWTGGIARGKRRGPT